MDNIFLAEGIFAIVANKDVWEKLPGDIQDVILKAAVETTA